MVWGNNVQTRLTSVKSGIKLDNFPNESSNSKSILPLTEPQSFITSRTARVLLAGAGFLADAVSFLFFFTFIHKFVYTKFFYFFPSMIYS